MIEGKDLFVNLRDEQGHYNVHAYLAQMIALLGPPPETLLQQERISRQVTFTSEIQNPEGQLCRNTCQYFSGPFFDSNSKIYMHWPSHNFSVLITLCSVGEFICKDLIPSDLRITETVTGFQGEDKKQFLDFLSKMLQ